MEQTMRDRFFAKAAVKRAIVTIEDVGDIEVRGLTVDARGDLLAACTTERENEETGETERITDLKKMQPALLTATVFDPATGAPFFTAGDRDAIGAMSGAFLDPLFKKASELSGLGDAALKKAAGNSAATTS